MRWSFTNGAAVSILKIFWGVISWIPWQSVEFSSPALALGWAVSAGSQTNRRQGWWPVIVSVVLSRSLWCTVPWGSSSWQLHWVSSLVLWWSSLSNWRRRFLFVQQSRWCWKRLWREKARRASLGAVSLSRLNNEHVHWRWFSLFGLWRSTSMYPHSSRWPSPCRKSLHGHHPRSRHLRGGVDWSESWSCCFLPRIGWPWLASSAWSQPIACVFISSYVCTAISDFASAGTDCSSCVPGPAGHPTTRSSSCTSTSTWSCRSWCRSWRSFGVGLSGVGFGTSCWRSDSGGRSPAASRKCDIGQQQGSCTWSRRGLSSETGFQKPGWHYGGEGSSNSSSSFWPAGQQASRVLAGGD